MTTTLTNSAQIDHLIAASNILTRLASFGGFDYLLDADDEIRAVLNDVPAGMREDVDALLGRHIAKPTTQVIMAHGSSGTRYDAAWFQREVINARNADTASPNPVYVDWLALNRMSKDEWDAATAANEAHARMSGAALDLAHAANQDDIDDMLEAAHDAAEDHRHLMSGD